MLALLFPVRNKSPMAQKTLVNSTKRVHIYNIPAIIARVLEQFAQIDFCNILSSDTMDLFAQRSLDTINNGRYFCSVICSPLGHFK